LGRRILKEDHTGASVVTWLYTYDGQKVVGEYDDSGASPVLARYYVDGAGYIDEHVLVNQQTGAQAGEYYYLLKELYSVAGLANANGEIVEAYDYDAYGKVRIFTTGLDICDGFGDFDGDCDVDIADFEALQLCYAAGGLPGDCPNSAAALARLDSDSDGDVDDTDLIAFVAAYTGPQGGLFADGDWNSNGALGPVDYNNFVNLCYSGPGGGFNTNGCQVYDFDGDGDVDLDDFGVLWDLLYDDAPSVEITLTAAERSAVNDYFFTGRRLDLVPHGGENHQRYYYRARTYNTERFMQRDPQMYIDGLNANEYASSQPVHLADPFGLQVVETGPGSSQDDWPRAWKRNGPPDTNNPNRPMQIVSNYKRPKDCCDRKGELAKPDNCFIIIGSAQSYTGHVSIGVDADFVVRQRYLGSSFEWGGADGCPGVTVRRPFDEC
jgi:RHS repeat-associated protein